MSHKHPIGPQSVRTPEVFYANEGRQPLRDAFSGRRAVHPFVGLSPVPESEWARTWDAMTKAARPGSSVAYLHVPYCERHCLFCGFYRQPWRESNGKGYVDALVAHLARDRERPYQADGPIRAAYFGGGTPSLLSADDITRAVRAVRDDLPLAPDCEITLEGRARDLDAEKARAIFDAGVNRLSIGVQSFDEGVRRQLGRHMGRQPLIRRLEDLVAMDRGAIVIDLIFGLPGQSLAVWEADVRTATRIGLDGADLYALKLMPHTPLGEAAQGARMAPAPTASHGDYYALGADLMAQARWEPLSSSHWRSGTRERNLYNLEVKAGASCLAFGAGAGGFLAGHSYRIVADVAEYAECVHQHRRLIGGLMRQSPHHRLFSFVKGSLERGCLDQSELAEQLAATSGLDLERVAGPLLDQWAHAGLLERNGRWLDLTLAGRFWQVTLAQNLLEWLDQAMRERPAPVAHSATLS